MTAAIEGAKIARSAKSAKTATAKRHATTRPANPAKKSSGKKAAPKKKPVPAKTVARKTGSLVAAPFDNKYAPRLKPHKSVVTYRHVLAAEFYTGIIVILYHRTKGVDHKHLNKGIVQLTAFMATWIVLFGVTTMGQKASRVSAWLGGLIVLTLVVRVWNTTHKGLPPDQWPSIIQDIMKGKSNPASKSTVKGGLIETPGNKDVFGNAAQNPAGIQGGQHNGTQEGFIA